MKAGSKYHWPISLPHTMAEHVDHGLPGEGEILAADLVHLQFFMVS